VETAAEAARQAIVLTPQLIALRVVVQAVTAAPTSGTPTTPIDMFRADCIRAAASSIDIMAPALNGALQTLLTTGFDQPLAGLVGQLQARLATLFDPNQGLLAELTRRQIWLEGTGEAQKHALSRDRRTVQEIYDYAHQLAAQLQIGDTISTSHA